MRAQFSQLINNVSRRTKINNQPLKTFNDRLVPYKSTHSLIQIVLSISSVERRNNC
ncbi:protein of unknown function [Cupriavidus taiwanensis]|nr:protein of unknown function [Cupriavidus taiwanensis]